MKDVLVVFLFLNTSNCIFKLCFVFFNEDGWNVCVLKQYSIFEMCSPINYYWIEPPSLRNVSLRKPLMTSIMQFCVETDPFLVSKKLSYFLFKIYTILTLHIKATFALRARAHSPQPQPPKMTQTSHRGRVPLFKIDENRVPYLKIAQKWPKKRWPVGENALLLWKWTIYSILTRKVPSNVRISNNGLVCT